MWFSQGIFSTRTNISHRRIDFYFRYILTAATMFPMAIDPTVLPDDIFSYENDAFYAFVRGFLGDVEAEITRVQCIEKARLLLKIPNVFSFLELNCDELLELKRQTCFIIDEVNFVVKSGIEFNIEYFVELVRSKSFLQSHSNRASSSPDVSTKFPEDIDQTSCEALAASNSRSSNPESKPFVYAFIDNILKNLNRPKNHFQYNPFVQKFASALHVLAGTKTYEYLRINLPGALPTITALEKYNQQLNIQLDECHFRFDSMRQVLSSMDAKFIFAVSLRKYFLIEDGTNISL